MGRSPRSRREQTDAGPTPRPRASLPVRFVETVLLCAGAACLIVYAAAQVDAVRGRDQALEAFARARSELTVAAATPDASRAASLEYSHAPDQSLWGQSRIAAYRESSNAAHDAPLGVLTIPSVRLEAPIFEGTSELALNRGVGRIEGTASLDTTGNVGLAAHRDGFFRALKDVKVGDAIGVESLAGTTRYRITELFVVEPSDVYVLEPTIETTLTLVTCYPFYFVGEAPQRYIVKAVVEAASVGSLL